MGIDNCIRGDDLMTGVNMHLCSNGDLLIMFLIAIIIVLLLYIIFAIWEGQIYFPKITK
jgi:hypothetical protein